MNGPNIRGEWESAEFKERRAASHLERFRSSPDIVE